MFLVKERIHHTLSASNLAFIGPLSWILTLQIFAISAIWWIAVSLALAMLLFRISSSYYSHFL
jgi:hypothetical protein